MEGTSEAWVVKRFPFVPGWPEQWFEFDKSSWQRRETLEGIMVGSSEEVLSKTTREINLLEREMAKVVAKKVWLEEWAQKINVRLNNMKYNAALLEHNRAVMEAINMEKEDGKKEIHNDKDRFVTKRFRVTYLGEVTPE